MLAGCGRSAPFPTVYTLNTSILLMLLRCV